MDVLEGDNGCRTYILKLTGSLYDMGKQYALALAPVLKDTLELVLDYYQGNHALAYDDLIAAARRLYNRYPAKYQDFFQGMASSGCLSLEQCLLLNAMETFELLTDKGDFAQCLFAYVPGDNGPFILRNYDYAKPFDEVAKHVVVCVFNDFKIPCATVTLPGQFYCPTGINAKGLFLELNNGMPSGGQHIDITQQSLLIHLLDVIAQSDESDVAKAHLEKINADFSLIINFADKQKLMSAEYTSRKMLKMRELATNTPYVSTNYFQDPRWVDLPKASDDTTWQGVSRRENLVKQINQLSHVDRPSLLSLMDIELNQGGSAWDLTLYQLLFEPQSLSLYIRQMQAKEVWQRINLKQYFKGMG